MELKQFQKFMELMTYNKKIVEEEITKFYSLFVRIINRNDLEKIALINKYIESEKDVYVCAIITCDEILEDRTCEQQIQLIDKYIESQRDITIFYNYSKLLFIKK